VDTDSKQNSMMKRSILALIVFGTIFTGCSTVQSIIRSTFPYTAILVVPVTSKINTEQSATSQASSFDQIFTGQASNTKSIRDVRVATVKIDATSPSGQTLGVFKSFKIYISRGDSSKELLIASRNDVATTVGSSIMLDADSTLLVDNFIKGSTVRIRVEYVLRSAIASDINLKASLGLSVAPNTAK
jgi:hypothetical protein